MESSQVAVLKAHVSLNVKDVKASAEFYTKMFGIDPVRVRPGYAKFDVLNPPLNLALNEVPSVSVGGALSHLGLQVISTDDVLAIRSRWAETGLITRDEMQTECCYARQDKSWVHDPDGNEWEVFVVLGEAENRKSSSSSCCAPTVATSETAAVGAAACC